MKKNIVKPSPLDDALSLFGNADEIGEVTDLDNHPYGDDDHQEDDEPDPAVVTEPEDDKKTDDTNPDNTDDDSEIPEDVLARMNGNQPVKSDDNNNNNDNDPEPVDNNDEDVSDADLAEAQQVTALFDAVVESFGFNPNDVNDDDKPVTVDGLTDYIRQVVDENSKPQYADDRIQKLDEYVKAGGKFEDFYSAQQEMMNLDNIDIEEESNQKAVVRELLKRSGYSDEKINRRIERFEDADMLEEEAEDALERLKEIHQKELEDAQKEQYEYQQAQEQQAREFFDSVSKGINKLTNIRGINVPTDDRKALYDYIFKTDATGQSQYQKDFNKNLTKNLIESAYFTMKGDALISEAQKDGESSAAKKLRNILRNSAKNHSTLSIKEEKQPQAWDIASKFLH